ncbi:MAG: hypothetical protein SGARI_005490 [Bacillariaceae sp.]
MELSNEEREVEGQKRLQALPGVEIARIYQPSRAHLQLTPRREDWRKGDLRFCDPPSVRVDGHPLEFGAFAKQFQIFSKDPGDFGWTGIRIKSIEMTIQHVCKYIHLNGPMKVELEWTRDEMIHNVVM